MKTIISFFMIMIMALALATIGEAATGSRSSNDLNLSAAPAYTDFTDSRDIPYKAGQNDPRTPDVMGW